VLPNRGKLRAEMVIFNHSHSFCQLSTTSRLAFLLKSEDRPSATAIGSTFACEPSVGALPGPNRRFDGSGT
jgi:hypothetical protein